MLNEGRPAKPEFVGSQFIDVVAAIDKIAASSPDRIAIQHGSEELTYGELRVLSDTIANTLRERCADGAVVAYCGERNSNWAATVIAILKSGSTYLPLDPSLPASRLSFMIKQSGCTLIIGQRPEALGLFEKDCESARQFMTVETALLGSRFSPAMPSSAGPRLAYILFTSGSTGTPKGVMVRRAGLNNHLMAKIDALELSEQDCVAQTASHGFDISLWQLLAGLCVGSCVAIIDDATLRSPLALLKALQAHRVAIVQFVPSVLAIFVEHLQTLSAKERLLGGLRMVSTVGEPLTPALARSWLTLYPQVPILNHYGPTECADGVTHHLISVPPSPADTYVPIGRPISNLEVYVASGLRLCKTGEVGEIYVSGVGVADGYINDSDRTRDAFVPNPFSDHPSYRHLYRTGDLGRIRADGVLECLGRRDRQIKLRGHRIELGEIESHLADNQIQLRGFRIELEEIEAALESYPGVARAAVLVEGADDDRRLVSLLAPAHENLTSGDILTHLRQALPSYMLPSDFRMVERMPLTPSGKIDRARLSSISSRPIRKTRSAEPRTEREQLLAAIWQELLGTKAIGIDDSFFDIGGNSLLSVRCVTLARNAGVNLTVGQLHRTPTIRQLATHQAPAATYVTLKGPLPVTPVVTHWNSIVGLGEHYNIGDLFFMPAGLLNISILERALVHVIGREEGLRLRINQTDRGLSQVIGSIADCPVEEVDLVGVATSQQLTVIERACAERQHSFRFDGRTPLVKVSAFRTSESGDYYLLVLLHHFVADGVGYRLFLNALDKAYSSLAAGRIAADPGTTPLSQWLARLNDYAHGEAPAELEHWESLRYELFDIRVSDAGSRAARFSAETARWLHYEGFDGPIDEKFCRSLWKDQATYRLRLNEETTTRLLKIVPTSAHCEDFDILLAAISGAFGRAFGNYSLWIDSLTSTRGGLFDDIDPSQTIGYIGELVPLPLYVAGTESRQDRARSIYQQRSSLPRKGIGFRALKFLNRHPAVRERADRLPLPRIGVNYRARLQRHYPRRLLSTDPHPLWIGEDMNQSVMNYLFWFRVGYQSGKLQIEVRYDPRQVGYESTRSLCTTLREELQRTVDAFAEANR